MNFQEFHNHIQIKMSFVAPSISVVFCSYFHKPRNKKVRGKTVRISVTANYSHKHPLALLMDDTKIQP